jgi:Tfp pilus assembly protein PilO
MMKGGKLSRPMAIGLILAGDVLLLVLGWVLLVAPQRSAASTMAKATQAAQAQIVEAQNAVNAGPPKLPQQPVINTAGLYELAKAMPDVPDMPDVLLELDQVARDSGVVVGTITPGLVTPGIGLPYSTVSIQVTFVGTYYDVTDMLFRLNSLVSVRDNELDASGRLFSVSTVSLSPAGGGRKLNGTAQMTAYVYGTGDSTAAAPVATPTTTDTTSTGTTTSSTTTASSSSDVAPQP